MLVVAGQFSSHGAFWLTPEVDHIDTPCAKKI